MLRKLCFIGVLLSATGTAHAADGYPEFRIGYQQQRIDIGNLFDPSQVVSLAGSTSATVHSYSLQVDFNKWVGVVYRHSQGSGTPVFISMQEQFGSTGVESGSTSIRGDSYAVEGRYPIYGWLDSFVRLNAANYSISASESDVFNLGLSASKSINNTYLSAGLRLKVSSHLGVEAEYDDFNSGLSPAISFGLYVQF